MFNIQTDFAFALVAFLQIGNTLRRCCDRAPNCECGSGEDDCPVLLPSPTDEEEPLSELPQRRPSGSYWVTFSALWWFVRQQWCVDDEGIFIIQRLLRYSTGCFRHHTFKHLISLGALLFPSVVSPPTCGCCWGFLSWPSSTPWPASSPGSWSSPSPFPRWMRGPWASFFSCPLRTSLCPPANRGRQDKASPLIPRSTWTRWDGSALVTCLFLRLCLASRARDQGAAVLLPGCELVLLQVHGGWHQRVCCQYPSPVCLLVFLSPAETLFHLWP